MWGGEGAGHGGVCRHLQRGFWRASKRWCKGMSEDAVTKALLRFANNGDLFGTHALSLHRVK